MKPIEVIKKRNLFAFTLDECLALRVSELDLREFASVFVIVITAAAAFQIEPLLATSIAKNYRNLMYTLILKQKWT